MSAVETGLLEANGRRNGIKPGGIPLIAIWAQISKHQNCAQALKRH